MDDDPDIRNLIGAFLKADGHTVEFAVNGLAGIGTALGMAPDLIVTDFQMPGMDGFALFNAVRANSEKKVPVVMVTAHHSKALMQKALSLGIDDFIGKPITREELARIVAPLLNPGAPRPAPTTRTLAATQSFGSVVCVQIGRLEAFMMQLHKTELAELLEQFRLGVAQAVQEDGGWLVPHNVHHLVMGFPEEGANNHAARALRCALKTVLAAQRLKPWIARRFTRHDLPEFLIAVGIHSGAILVRGPRGGGVGELKGEAVDGAALLAASGLSLRWSVAVTQAAAKAAQFGFLAGRNANIIGADGAEIGVIEVKGFAAPVQAPAPAPKKVEPPPPPPPPKKKAAPPPKKAEPPPPPPKKAEPPPPKPAEPAPPAPAPVSDKAAVLVEAAIERNDQLVVAAAQIPKKPAAPAKPSAHAAKLAARLAADKGKPAAAAPKKGAPSFAPPPAKEPEKPPPPPVDPFESRTVVLKLADNGIVTVHLTIPKSGGAQEVLKGFLINDDKKQTKRKSLYKFIEQYAAFRELEHPNLARVTDHGLSQTHLFVAQEYCAGGDLRNLIAQGMTPDDALKALLRVAGGLKAAHAKGFVHGDLRPANVMIREDGSFALVDVAIARVVEFAVAEGDSGTLLRSPEYLAPEMINGEPADVRSDIYALGLLLHEMLTGKRAYAYPDLSKVMMDQLNAPVPVLPTPHERFQPLLEKLMAKDIASRFDTIAAVMEFMADAKLSSGEKPAG